MTKPNLKVAALAALTICLPCNSNDELQGPTAETKALSSN
jgi:alpha-amylase